MGLSCLEGTLFTGNQRDRLYFGVLPDTYQHGNTWFGFRCTVVSPTQPPQKPPPKRLPCWVPLSSVAPAADAGNGLPALFRIDAEKGAAFA